MSDASEDGEISEPHDYIIDDDSLDIKPPQNQAGSKHKSGREKHSIERKRRDKHKHRRHESRRQRREHRERRAERSSDTSHRASEPSHHDVLSVDAHEHRDRDPHDALTHDTAHDLLPPAARPSRSHERRESRRERRAERESRKARDQPPPVLESRGGYRETVDDTSAPVRDSSREGRHRTERRDAAATEVDLRRERFLQAMRVSEHQKEMSRRELEARRHRREVEKQRQREQREIELKREREYSDDRETSERRKRSRRVVEIPDEAPDHTLEAGERTRESDRETREREPRDGRERESRADRQGREREARDREPRDREPREGRERESRENRERGARETREREGRDREREYREGRGERELREERTREREGREIDLREDRERLKKVESDHSSAEEEAEDEEDGGEESEGSSSEEESGEESGDENEEEEEEDEDVTHVSPEGAAPPSRSPTPPVTGRRWRQTSRSSAENGASPSRKRSPAHSSPPHSPPDLTTADSPPPSPVELKETLPPYLPAVSGCRNVEEFNCLNRIEEGTYGVVYRAVDKRTKEIVALKRLKMENEKEGFPITSLREINTLLKAQHENIVTVREIVVGSNMDKIYIVMDYVEHDLKSLMQTMKSKKQSFTTGEVKCLLLQMLRAVRHLHDNWILHRDLKTSNLLLSHKGILKVGDFGLAREYGSPLKAYTPVVVTLWYRAPELLLGVKEYACPIDMWSVGCIFGELVRMDPMFPGKSEADQINRIFKELGTPNEKIWPGYSELPAIKKMTFTEYPYNQLTTKLGGAVTDKGVTLMNKLLTYDPKRRLAAEDALAHSYFDEQPRPIEPSMFPTWPAKSEQTHKRAGGNSPKPPSGRKNLGDEDVGFQLGAAAGAGGFSLKF